MRDWKAYYQKNKEVYSERNKKYRLSNKEKVAQRHAEYKLKNPDKAKEYYQKNKDKIIAKSHKRYHETKQLKSTKENLGSKTKELWKDPEYRKRMSDAHKGNKGYWEGKELTEDTKEKLSKAHILNPTRYWLNKKGECTPGYIHGKHVEHQRERKSLEYRRWRRSVFKRDNFTCVFCGAKFIKGVSGGIIIHADHIKPFALFPKLRLELSNGRTLCEPCHKKTPTYMKKFTKEMYKEL
jgi:hypothetical protein